MPVVFTHTSLISQLVVTQLSGWHPFIMSCSGNGKPFVDLQKSPSSLSERRQTAVFSPTWAAWLAYEGLPALHLVAEMGLTINVLPHTFVLSDKLLGAI